MEMGVDFCGAITHVHNAMLARAIASAKLRVCNVLCSPPIHIQKSGQKRMEILVGENFPLWCPFDGFTYINFENDMLNRN